MYDLMTFLSVMAGMAWIIRPLALDFAPAVVTPDGTVMPQPEERPAWEESLMFKKGGGGGAPDPDPKIGEAAMKNAELGEDWLEEARKQFDINNERQKNLDALTETVTNKQLSQQDRMNRWAQEDRADAAEDREWSKQQRDRLNDWTQQDRDSSLSDREWGLELRDRVDSQNREDRQFALDSRDRFNEQGDRFRDRADQIGETADQLQQQADEDRQFSDRLRGDYDDFRQVNDRVRDDAMNWDSEGRLAERAAQARGDVMSSSAQAQQQQQRQQAAMGVNPASGRSAAANRSLGLQTSVAAAGAQNQARDQARQQAVGMRQNAASLGQQVLSQSQQASGLAQNSQNLANSTTGMQNQTESMGMSADQAALGASQYGSQVGSGSNTLGAAGFAAGQYNSALGSAGLSQNANNAVNNNAGLGAAGLSLNSGNSAIGNVASANQQAASNFNTLSSGFQGAMSGNSSSASILNQQYGNELNAYNAQQQAQQQGIGGLMSAAGTIGGAAIMASSKEYKENKRPADGALDAVDSMPIERWKYKDGISDGGEHIGPYAEDWQAATGQGDGKSIALQDAIGLNMKATQELSRKVDGLMSSRKPQQKKRKKS